MLMIPFAAKRDNDISIVCMPSDCPAMIHEAMLPIRPLRMRFLTAVVVHITSAASALPPFFRITRRCDMMPTKIAASASLTSIASPPARLTSLRIASDALDVCKLPST